MIPDQLSLREIHSTDDPTRISLGHSDFLPLKNFLRNCSKDFHQLNIAKTYVLVAADDNPRIWGYISLVTSEITLDDDQRPNECLQSQHYDTFPAVKIARLATDKSLRGKGYGGLMLEWALSLVEEAIMPVVGCRYVTVDSKRTAVSFYEKYGFTMLQSIQNQESDNPLLLI